MKSALSKWSVVCLILCLEASLALAAQSRWVETEGGRIRLIGLPSPDGQSYRAALDVDLKPGWKTYWRAQGNGDLPPQIDFSASQNILSAELDFPTPQLFAETYGDSVGYKGRAVLPIRVTPAPNGKPFTLRARGLIGVCEDICIPADFDLSLESDKGATRMDTAMLLRDAYGKLPAKPTDRHAIVSASLKGGTDNEITVQARVPTDAREVRLFVDPPMNWPVNHAPQIHRDEELVTFSFAVSVFGKTPKLVGETVRFTLVADGQSVQQAVVVEE